MDRRIVVNPNAKALIFDIDGTLADTMPAHFKAFKTVLGRYGITMTQELFNSIAGVPVKPQMELFKKLFNPPNFIPEIVAVEKEEEYFKTINVMKPIDVVLDVLISNVGKMPIGCGTGGDRKIAYKTLEVIGVHNKVNAVVTCEDVENGKPAPDTFLKCAQLLGVKPEYCQVFEDGQPGIEAAINAGMMVTDIREYL